MTGSTVRSVRVILSASTAGYIAEMKRAGAATEGVAAGMKASGREASIAQRSWGIAAKGIKVGAAGAAIGLVAAGKAAADFQSEMALVKTLSHATRPEMKLLEDQALHMGSAWGYGATQVASGQEELIKAGVSLEDILHGGLKGTLALAAAGQTDVATATETAAAAMTQFKLKGKDVPHIADLLAAGADKALGSVTDLGDGLSQVGTTAHQMGFSIEETIGTLAEFAQAGLQGQRGGTVLNQMLLQLASPTEKAKGLMDKYGLSLYDANGNIKTMSELAGNLRESFSNLSPAQRNYALGVIFGSRAIRGANILLKDGAKANADWTRKVNDAGFAAHQASGKLDSLKGDWQKLKSVAQTGLIELGSGEQNPLRHLVQNVTSDIKRLEHDGTLKRWGREIGHDLDTVITKAGPLAHDVGHALSVVGHGIGQIVTGFNKLPDGVQKAIVTGGVVAYGAHKLGLDAPIKALLRRGVGGTVAGIAGRGVVPVFVTNKGFGGPGGPGGIGGRGNRGPSGKAPLLAASPFLLPLLTSGDQAQGQNTAGMNRSQRSQYNRQIRSISYLENTLKTAGGHTGSYDTVLNAILGKNPQQGIAILQQAARISGTSLPKFLKWIGVSGGEFEKSASAAQAYNNSIKNQAGLTDLLLAPAMKLGQTYRSLPRQVRTQIATPGAITSLADVKRLARQYDLTPKQIRTIIQLTGVAAAAAAARSYANMLAGINGQVATTYLRQVVEHPVAGGGHPIYTSTGSARGNIFTATAYASGDVANRHQPELGRPGGHARVWLEPETKGEAYIPLANDDRRARAVAIWQQTGHLLGVHGFAGGGFAGAPQRVAAVPRVSVGGAQVRVFIDGREVRAIVQQETAADQRFNRSLAGMRPE